MDALRYPIGKFEFPKNYDRSLVLGWISTIAEFPGHFRNQVNRMSASDLSRPYREGGWNGRQVIHHVPDSHLNAYCRFKLALTEDKPTIKPYFEDRWAKLKDTTETEIDISLKLLESLHTRWNILLENLTDADWQKSYLHPEYGNEWPLYAVAALYAWHGNHHLGHLKLITP